MELEDLNLEEVNGAGRPTFLKVLAILSFIFIGFSLLFGVVGLVQGPLDEEAIMEQKVQMSKSIDEMRSLDLENFAQIMEKIERMSESINANFYAASTTSLLIMIIGLFSVVRMWQGFKNGFHLYIIYSLLSVVQIYFFVSAADVPSFVIIWNLLIAGLFIFLYSRNLKWMTK